MNEVHVITQRQENQSADEIIAMAAGWGTMNFLERRSG